MLHERPHHRRGAVRTQRERAAALVLEVVQLLAHDVRARPELLHDLDVLEHRRDEQTETGTRRACREARDECLPPIGLRRQHVTRPDGRAEHISTRGHEVRW